MVPTEGIVHPTDGKARNRQYPTEKIAFNRVLTTSEIWGLTKRFVKFKYDPPKKFTLKENNMEHSLPNFLFDICFELELYWSDSSYESYATLW